MARTYLPTLLAIVRKLCAYIVKYRDTLNLYMPEVAQAAFEVLADACDDFLAVFPAPVPPA